MHDVMLKKIRQLMWGVGWGFELFLGKDIKAGKLAGSTATRAAEPERVSRLKIPAQPQPFWVVIDAVSPGLRVRRVRIVAYYRKIESLRFPKP